MPTIAPRSRFGFSTLARRFGQALLVEQISLIQPRVIVTLGNFATKYVLQTQTGITRMRGQVYPWHERLVIPTFHPAAILRGGGEGSTQFGQLREDFALVQRTLAQPPGGDEPSRGPAPGVPERATVVHLPEAPDEEQLGLF